MNAFVIGIILLSDDPDYDRGTTCCRDDWIRTSDSFVPNEVRYRAALHPENKTG
jgi:hypothetical protein